MYCKSQLFAHRPHSAVIVSNMLDLADVGSCSKMLSEFECMLSLAGNHRLVQLPGKGQPVSHQTHLQLIAMAL
jgi:hypothetical protein